MFAPVVCVFVCACVLMRACVHECMCAHASMCMCVCTYACIWCICTYLVWYHVSRQPLPGVLTSDHQDHIASCTPNIRRPWWGLTTTLQTYRRTQGCAQVCVRTHTDKPVCTETKYNSHRPIPPKPLVVCIGTCLPQKYHHYPRNKRPSPQSPPPLQRRPSCASEHNCLETQHTKQRCYILLQMSWSVM